MKYESDRDRANVIVPLRKTLVHVFCISIDFDLILEAYYTKCSCISGFRGIYFCQMSQMRSMRHLYEHVTRCGMVVEQGNDSVMVVISFHDGPLCW